MRYFDNKFYDNCYELFVLRWFRDNFVTSDDVKHYYDVASEIVKRINKDNKRFLVYSYIFDNITYCIDEIENGNYEVAYNMYKECVKCLEEYYSLTVENENSMKLKYRIAY